MPMTAPRRRCDLPAEELLADQFGLGDVDGHERLTRVGERLQPRFQAVIVVALHLQVHKQAVVAVDGGRADHLQIDRHDAHALLPSGFGQQLLQPGAERHEALGRQDRQLVANRPRPLRR